MTDPSFFRLCNLFVEIIYIFTIPANLRYDKEKRQERTFMQQGLFTEKLVKRKRTGADLAMSIILVLAAVAICVLFYVIALYVYPALFTVAIIAPLGLGYLTFRIIRKMSVEYEYSMVNDELVIDKITAQSKRKNVFTGSCKEFAIVARTDDPEYKSYAGQNLLKLDLRSGEDHGCDWFLVTKNKDRNTLLLFEPDERFITAFRKYNPRAVKQVRT